jgi:hypothetical protein
MATIVFDLDRVDETAAQALGKEVELHTLQGWIRGLIQEIRIRDEPFYLFVRVVPLDRNGKREEFYPGWPHTGYILENEQVLTQLRWPQHLEAPPEDEARSPRDYRRPYSE